MPPATIRDVAKRAGVGIGTVSRVLNDHPSVSQQTRQRVEDAIQALNYWPNPIARQLSLGKSSNIAVMAPFFIRPSSVERLRGVESVLSAHNYDVVLFNVETRVRRDMLYQSLPRGEQFDGMLVVTLGPTDIEVEQLSGSGLPVVLVDTYHPDLCRVRVDDELGGYMATRHLLDLGHTRIAIISDLLESPFRTGGASLLRFRGYRKALHEAGIGFNEDYYRQDQHGVQEAEAMTHTLLSLPQPPTAIFAVSDTQAIGVLRAAEARGLNLPGDLSVIGFDDIEVAQYLNLTTIRQPLFESGVQGAELLLRCLHDGRSRRQYPEEIKLPLELVVRQTTAPPAV